MYRANESRRAITTLYIPLLCILGATLTSTLFTAADITIVGLAWRMNTVLQAIVGAIFGVIGWEALRISMSRRDWWHTVSSLIAIVAIGVSVGLSIALGGVIGQKIGQVSTIYLTARAVIGGIIGLVVGTLLSFNRSITIFGIIGGIIAGFLNFDVSISVTISFIIGWIWIKKLLPQIRNHQ